MPALPGAGRRCAPFFLFLALVSCVASAAPVELRLVQFDQPEVTVDKLEKERPITNPISTGRGVEMKKIGVDYTGWGRNILLDGKPVFERYYEGKYIDRLPIARPDLPPGKHTIWPGNHVFTVAADGAVTTESAELIAAAGVVKIKCYPVTVSAFLANPDEAELPMTMRATPLPNLTLRDAGQAAAAGKAEPLELLPIFEKFVPLTLWLPANTEGQGYLVYPVGLTFHLSAAGVAAGAGGGESIDGLRVQKNQIEIPVHSFPIVGDAGTKIVITGVDQLSWYEHDAGEPKPLVLYPRREPFEFLITKPGPAISLTIGPMPFKSFRVDIPDPSTGAQRALAVELAKRHFAPSEVITARVRALDAAPAHAANRASDRARNAASLATRDLKAVQAKVADAEKELIAAQVKEKAAARAVRASEIQDRRRRRQTRRRDRRAEGRAGRYSCGAEDGPDPHRQARGSGEGHRRRARRDRSRRRRARHREARVCRGAGESDGAWKAWEAAKTGLPAAEQAVEKTTAAAAEATKQIEANSGLNPLEKAAPFAQLQLYGSTAWQDLAAQPGADGEVKGDVARRDDRRLSIALRGAKRERAAALDRAMDFHRHAASRGRGTLHATRARRVLSRREILDRPERHRADPDRGRHAARGRFGRCAKRSPAHPARGASRRHSAADVHHSARRRADAFARGGALSD